MFTIHCTFKYLIISDGLPVNYLIELKKWLNRFLFGTRNALIELIGYQ